MHPPPPEGDDIDVDVTDVFDSKTYTAWVLRSDPMSFLVRFWDTLS